MGNEPLKKYFIEIDDIGAGVEQHYFHLLNLLRLNKYKVDKTKDVFASSEMSSFWADMARRRSEQEQRAMQLMATLNGMVKDLFKVMRSMLIMEERLSFYEKSKEGDPAGDSSLKDIWVTLVEQGSKNPASVLGMATQVGFAPLPDYFYTTQVKEGADIDKTVEAYDVSEKMKYVLKRKLSQFTAWRGRTEKELRTRLRFLKSVLKAHISQIRLYAQWLKPYLKAINRLRTLQEEKPELVTAFETAWLEIQLEATKPNEKDYGDYIPVIKLSITQTTLPGEAFQQNYQKGYLHRGKVGMTFEAFLYKKDEFEKEKKKGDVDLIDFLIENVNESITEIKDDLIRVMNEDYEKIMNPKKKKEEKKEERKRGMKRMVLEVFPFLSFLFREKKKEKGPNFFSAIIKTQNDAYTDKKNKDAAKKVLEEDIWKVYETFKKTRGMAAA